MKRRILSGRTLTYAVGTALIAVGLRGIVLHVGTAGWATWFVGAIVAHDGVLVPAVLGIGLLTGRLPLRYRWIAQGALIVAGCVTAVAVPLVLGYGRRPDDPSRLPLPYDRNLAIVLGLIAAITALALLARGLSRGRRTTPPRRPHAASDRQETPSRADNDAR